MAAPEPIYSPPPLFVRFWAKVAIGAPDECWLWMGCLNSQGYGQFRVEGRTREAHRVAYELLIGPIPEGLELDHVRARGCFNRHCVNPAHLEPVTTRENGLRSESFAARNAAKTHCNQGHPFDEENTYRRNGTRSCRACNREAVAHLKARRQAVAS